VTVIVSATRSTVWLTTSGMRCAAVIDTNWILFGSPKIAFAIACAMSMSKPTIWPLAGSRYPNLYVFWSTPTRRVPRA
jgi:hypothetical protein